MGAWTAPSHRYPQRSRLLECPSERGADTPHGTAASSQEELYNQCGITALVDAALQGYSVTVFAFGQTGTGKTHRYPFE
jgi:hypothetical protein